MVWGSGGLHPPYGSGRLGVDGAFSCHRALCVARTVVHANGDFTVAARWIATASPRDCLLPFCYILVIPLRWDAPGLVPTWPGARLTDRLAIGLNARRHQGRQSPSLQRLMS